MSLASPHKEKRTIAKIARNTKRRDTPVLLASYRETSFSLETSLFLLEKLMHLKQQNAGKNLGDIDTENQIQAKPGEHVELS